MKKEIIELSFSEKLFHALPSAFFVGGTLSIPISAILYLFLNAIGIKDHSYRTDLISTWFVLFIIIFWNLFVSVTKYRVKGFWFY